MLYCVLNLVSAWSGGHDPPNPPVDTPLDTYYFKLKSEKTNFDNWHLRYYDIIIEFQLNYILLVLFSSKYYELNYNLSYYTDLDIWKFFTRVPSKNMKFLLLNYLYFLSFIIR